MRDSNEQLNGYCRRQPPKVVVYEEEPDCLWPIVSEDDWCIEGFIVSTEHQGRRQEVGDAVGEGRTECLESSTVIRFPGGKGGGLGVSGHSLSQDLDQGRDD